MKKILLGTFAFLSISVARADVLECCVLVGSSTVCADSIWNARKLCSTVFPAGTCNESQVICYNKPTPVED